MPDCPVKCLENPDAVDKTDWKCNHCGADLEDAFNAKQKASQEFYDNQDNLEREARAKATEAFNKVFKDEMQVKIKGEKN